MSLRPPQNLTPDFKVDPGATRLEIELKAEQASVLGALGRDMQKSLETLKNDHSGDAARHSERLDAAVRAVWHYFIQRETCGLIDHHHVIEYYQIPQRVIARLGSVKR